MLILSYVKLLRQNSNYDWKTAPKETYLSFVSLKKTRSCQTPSICLLQETQKMIERDRKETNFTTHEPLNQHSSGSKHYTLMVYINYRKLKLKFKKEKRKSE